MLIFNKTSSVVPAVRFQRNPELQKYVGTDRLHNGSKLVLHADQNTLDATLDQQPSFPVFKTRDRWFEYEIVKASLPFESNDKEPIASLKPTKLETFLVR